MPKKDDPRLIKDNESGLVFTKEGVRIISNNDSVVFSGQLNRLVHTLGRLIATDPKFVRLVVDKSLEFTDEETVQ